MDPELRKNLGPLAALAGVWEGEKGDDVAPSPSRGTENNRYRERLRFEPFHEEVGYWMWDAAGKQVMRCFIVTRGVSVLAGGTVEPDARRFVLTAERGAPVYGVCSNAFLDRELRTVRYELELTIEDDTTFRYAEDTQLQIRGQNGIFHHRDSNTLRRIELP